MAGYIMTLNISSYKDKAKKILRENHKQCDATAIEEKATEIALEDMVSKGVYSTKFNFKENTKNWNIQKLATLGDYITMKEGDYIFFFVKRKIYGFGKLINIAGYDCKFKNFNNANNPSRNPITSKEEILFLPFEKIDTDFRFICTFEPKKYFFKKGVDMDEILSFKPASYKMLRAMWKVSFIKVDDEEAIALRNHLLKNNEDSLISSTNYFNFNPALHQAIAAKITNTPHSYHLSARDFLPSTNQLSEMGIETIILNDLSNDISPLGHFDFITHQYIASPFKPIDYMDKMDLFGYRYINNFNGAISKYLVGEIKKGVITEQDIEQLMKYVDWVAREYAYGDYDMIEAFIIGSGMEKKLDYFKNIFYRIYTKGTRPTKTNEWNNLKFINYNNQINLINNYRDSYEIKD